MRSSAIRLSHSALPIHRSVLMHPTNQIGTITQRTQAQLGLTQFQTISRRHNSTHFLPTILQPAFWRNIIPKALRNRRPQPEEGAIPPPRAKDWNPATYFIVIFLLIGSQAIQTIALQNSFTHFSQQTEARLSLLRDVLKRVQAGENVDVEAELGTGDEVKEKQWADGKLLSSTVVIDELPTDTFSDARTGRRGPHDTVKKSSPSSKGGCSTGSCRFGCSAVV
jgi:hypothetical protein